MYAGASKRTRTADPFLTMEVLYRTELWKQIGSTGRTRTCDRSVNSRLLYQLSYCGIIYKPSDVLLSQGEAPNYHRR